MSPDALRPERPATPRSRPSPSWRRLLAIAAVTTVLVGAARQSLDDREQRARRAIQAAFDTTGNSWVHFDVAGRAVHLRGPAPSDEAAAKATTIAKSARCSTWRGKRPCARSAATLFGDGGPAWPELGVRVDRGVMSLTGRVPDAALHWAVVDRARSALQRGRIWRIDDELTVLELAAPAGADATASKVVAMVALCTTGEARLQDGVVDLECQVDPEAEAALKGLLDLPLMAGYLGQVRLTVSPEADR